MRSKVTKLTQMFFDKGSGDQQQTAQLFANFISQRAVCPFVKPLIETPRDRFAENTLETLKKVRAQALKPGGSADMFRRAVIASGACGPLSNKQV